MDQQQLDNILQYQNEDILSRFMDMYIIDETEASDIFAETKKFLYLCQLPNIFIPDELLIVDEMWHNFILFTKEYHVFCEHHFGRYFHHLPASKKDKEQLKRNNEADPEGVRREFEDKLGYVISCAYDHLGTDTVVKWFQQYPRQYSKENITQLRRY